MIFDEEMTTEKLKALLKPMATAPKEGRVLCLYEYYEMGKPAEAWDFLYHVNEWDGQPAGWCKDNWGDRRTPLGWVFAL